MPTSKPKIREISGLSHADLEMFSIYVYSVAVLGGDLGPPRSKARKIRPTKCV